MSSAMLFMMLLASAEELPGVLTREMGLGWPRDFLMDTLPIYGTSSNFEHSGINHWMSASPRRFRRLRRPTLTL